MAAMSAIRGALADALEVVDGLRVYRTMPDSVVTPAAIIQPASPFATYEQKMGGSVETEWRFELILVAGRIAEAASQDLLDEFASPDGPVLAAIQPPGSVAGVDYATVVQAQRYGALQFGSGDYLSMQLLVEVRA